ncbi:hypothetical protein GCM10025868_04760 [Angustibacter aerolatus]|uniref:Uncharacterized protein n=1 Tax=Angustibacter aerolatus TaxID=1162965 RepID=A0ABQ6JAL6_9ACTN|nr:hypothetical protein GCM10025868_04760 [Angustibacter aerolatus]
MPVCWGRSLLRLVLPGVPDVYQGTELVDLSLVDPDNRRPVDYAERRRRLAALDAGEAPGDVHDEKPSRHLAGAAAAPRPPGLVRGR